MNPKLVVRNLIFLWRISLCPSQVNRRGCTGMRQSSLRVAIPTPSPQEQNRFLLWGGYRLHVGMDEEGSSKKGKKEEEKTNNNNNKETKQNKQTKKPIWVRTWV